MCRGVPISNIASILITNVYRLYNNIDISSHANANFISNYTISQSFADSHHEDYSLSKIVIVTFYS